MKYRKKPVEIEAYQFNPNGAPYYKWGDNFPGVSRTDYMEVHTLLGTSGCSKEAPYWSWPAIGTVKTIHGQTTVVVPGDYIIMEPDGIHYYPCKQEIFEKTHDLVV